MANNRDIARTLAADAIRRGKPLEWFEVLYQKAGGEPDAIPWADLVVNPNLREWICRNEISGSGKSALVIGCGLGDDAESLAKTGFSVTAFDVSATCIDWCRRRFRGSSVKYCLADVISPPPAWHQAFDFVFEAYTLQVLPADLRPSAARNISEFVARGGELLVVARGRDHSDDTGDLPWPLTHEEMHHFANTRLTEITFEDYIDEEQPPVRRFRAHYVRKSDEPRR